MNSSSPESSARRYPAPRAAWLLVALLTMAYVLSFVDRYILGLLIQPIKDDLGLTDEQIGWVIGPAFAIFYATMGLPLGWLVDRARRTWIVSAGIFVWSLATAASGLAHSFWQLFVARMAVGIGEASLGPSATSMIADSFPSERRGKPISVYVAATSLGGGLASLIGGSVLIWAKTTESLDFPIVGALAPWQMAFFVVGLPGLLFALLFMLVKEPMRGAALDKQTESAEPNELTGGNGLRDAARHVRRWSGAYGGTIALACVMAIVAYSQGFLAATFERTWGWPPEKYALINGVALLAVGPAVVVLTGSLSDRWSQAGVSDAALRLLFIGYYILLPTSVLPMFMPSGGLAYALLCLNTAGIGMVSAMAVAVVLALTPSRIRGQAMALYYMIISLTGLFLGPTAVGLLSTRVFGEENIRYAMASVPVLFGVLPLLLIPHTRRCCNELLAARQAARREAS